jgi:hypothetical protein
MNNPFGTSTTITTINGNLVNPVNTRDTDSCILSPHDKFLSTVLTAIIGSIINGISSGFFIAFCTTWICWFATMRIVVVGIWFCRSAVMGQNLRGLPWFTRLQRMTGSQHASTSASEVRYDPIAPPSYEESTRIEFQSSPYISLQSQAPKEPRSETTLDPAKPTGRPFMPQAGPPTFLGWAGWLYVTVYFPVVQILWLISNWSDGPSSGNLKLVRAIGVSVTALPLTMDIKTRYAVSLEQRFGRWAARLFTSIHAFSTLALGILSTIMLIVAVRQMPIPIFFIPIYVIFSTIWMVASFGMVPPFDGGMSPNSIPSFAAGLAIGIFGGAFTSAPAFGSMGMAASTPGVGLEEYLKCEGVNVWEKFVAIFP